MGNVSGGALNPAAPWTLADIPDASRRQPPTPQDFGCISFVWGLSRQICQKVDVVWFEKLQSLW